MATTREEDIDLEREGEDEDEETQTTEEGSSFFSRVNWSLVLSMISVVGVVILFITQPEDLKQDVDWLLAHASAQGDSLKAVADTVAVHENRLDNHWTRMDGIENTMAVAAKVDSALGVVKSDIGSLQKVASKVKKLESEARQSLDLSRMTREELELLKRTFGDHAALRSRDAHGDRKIASNKTSSQSNGDDWEFVSQGGGSR